MTREMIWYYIQLIVTWFIYGSYWFMGGFFLLALYLHGLDWFILFVVGLSVFMVTVCNPIRPFGWFGRDFWPYKED